MTQIYLHGLGQTSTAWENTVMGLDSAENIVCPNLSDLLQGKEAAYLNLYSAFSNFCDGFDEELDLCGLSLGGVLALHYVIDHPEKVRSLVLIAAQYKMPKLLLRFQNVIFRLMPESMFRQTGFGKTDFLMLCKTMAKLDFSASICKVTCPTLVVCGEKDSANRKAAMELASSLEHAELQIVRGAGHEVNVDAPGELEVMLHNFYKFQFNKNYRK